MKKGRKEIENVCATVKLLKREDGNEIIQRQEKRSREGKHGLEINTIRTHGVQEQTIGRKKCSRLLTWE